MNTTTTDTTPQAFPTGLITGYETRKTIKTTQKFKNLNNVWDDSHLDYVESIGHCMPTIRKYRPKTFAEWVEIYITHCKTWEELKEVGARWSDFADLGITEAIAHVIIHSIDETWDGYYGELVSENLMRAYHEPLGQTVEEASLEDDMNYGVDFIIKEGDTILYGIQVKPSGFFFSKRIEKQKRQYKWQNANFTRETGAPVYYVNTATSMNGKLKYIEVASI
jgi:hypothetical protein